MSAKSAAHEADVTRQTQEKEAIKQQLLAQLVPGSDEYRQLTALNVGGDPGLSHQQVRDLGAQLVSQQQARVSSGGAATPMEQRTNLSVQALRQAAAFTPEEQDVLSALQGHPTSTPIGQTLANVLAKAQESGALPAFESISPQAQLLSQTIQRRLTMPPQIPFEDTLPPELNLVRQQVQAEAARRGLTGSGLELENMGRAGVDLAIKQAQLRQQNAAVNEVLRQQTLAEGSGLVGAQQAYGQYQQGLRQQALTNATSAYGLGQNLRNRQIGLEGDVTNLQAGRESRLTDLLSRSSQNAFTNLNDILQNRTSTFQSLADVALQRQLAQQAALGQLAGTVGGATIGSFIPGIGTALGSYLGSQVGGGMTGSATNPGSPGWLLALQRAGQGRQPAVYGP